MAHYIVKTSQLLLATILSAAISAGTIIAYQQWKDKQGIPEVQYTVDGKCSKVINYKNGEAYNCQDVDVVLRVYKKSIDEVIIKTESSATSQASTPEQEPIPINNKPTKK